jgi:hypothetical protein
MERWENWIQETRIKYFSDAEPSHRGRSKAKIERVSVPGRTVEKDFER